MAGYEHKAQEVVADVIVNRGIEIRCGHVALGLDFATELFVLALKPLLPAQEIDRTMFRGGHKPSAGVARNARLRPLLERGDESILSELLGKTNVAHDSSKTGNEPSRLDP